MVSGFESIVVDSQLTRKSERAEAIEIGGNRERTTALIANQARLLRPRA